jgi:general secretion pathway protein D
MNRKNIAVAVLLSLPLITTCASYKSYEKAKTAERTKDWDQAVLNYQKALDVDPENFRFKVALQRARLEASRVHFERAKSLRAAALTATNSSDALRLNQLAATDFELTVKLDSTNQYAAVELSKTITAIQDAMRAQDKGSLEEMKKRAKANITKTQPPQLNPASDQPISLTFPKETPVKEIYHALGSAFGINVMFDQAVKDDRITIELKDVTAQQALERVMQAANHFYKVLDEHTIIIAPDNPQARRDYEDLVIRTFYLSNGDAEQVTNVVRTMIEARNLFPLKALNAITIRDTADKVRIAEKIIEANDKAKAEVVVDVELLQMDLTNSETMGAFVSGLTGNLSPTSATSTTQTTGTITVTDSGTNQTSTTTTTGTATVSNPLGTTKDIFNAIQKGHYSFTIPSVAYGFAKSLGNALTLANPELRISEGEKATLHIGQRIPIPVTTFQTAVSSPTNGAFSPATSYQYQDVGIKVAIEPRVHHNREVTLKLSVEVSDIGASVDVGGGLKVPQFNTRTIEDTIRLKDGETNFLAGLIQRNETNGDSKTPFLGDIPIIGRLFTQNTKTATRTDLMLTMTPHIIRVPDITDDDLAPMWVGTQNNLTFRGISPRIESQAGTADPFIQRPEQYRNTPTLGGEPGNYIQTPPTQTSGPTPINGAPPAGPFGRPAQTPPPPPPNPEPQSRLMPKSPATPVVALAEDPSVITPLSAAAMALAATSDPVTPSIAVGSRISPQPVHLAIKPGEMKTWSVVGMDLDGLSTNEILLHFDARTLSVMDVSFGDALVSNPQAPPVATIDSGKGLVRITSSNGQPLTFSSGGDIAILRVQGGLAGDTFLVVDIPEIRNAQGGLVTASVVGGKARVE